MDGPLQRAVDSALVLRNLSANLAYPREAPASTALELVYAEDEAGNLVGLAT
jgi:hypothetical protein